MKNKLSILILFSLVSCGGYYMSEDQAPISQLNSSEIEAIDASYQNGFTWDTLANGIILKKVDTLYIWQEDMVFFEEDLSFLCPTRSAARTESSYYWPGGKVYYSYHSSLSPSDTLKCSIAMSIIMANTSITFAPQKPNTANYVEFIASDESKSKVGMKGGKQDIKLNTDAFDYGTVMHEILHALGFFHEHCRSDRNDSLVVYTENIKPGKEYNFQRYQERGYLGTDIGSFDFNSIMLYSSFAFSKNGLATMKKIDGSTFEAQRTHLSDGDKEGIAAVYGPPFHRLESWNTIVEELVSGSTDKLITFNTDSLVFYSDRACTVREALQYPREIRVKTTQTVAGYDNWNYQSTSWYWTVTIPAGTTAYCLSQWTDTEWYENSNPYYYNITTNEIVNYLAPCVFMGEY